MKAMIAIAVLVGALGAVSAAEKDAAPSPEAAAFLKNCASCHGKDGKGKAPMAKMFKVGPEALDLVDKDTIAKTDEELLKVTSTGKGKMPAYEKKMKAEELSALVAYIRSLGPKKE